MRQMLCPLLVGRQSERAVLEGALAAAGAGEGRMLVLAGEPGVGKSRLAREAAGEARAAGMNVLWGRAAPSGGPVRALAEAVLSWGRGRMHWGPGEQQVFEAARSRLTPGDAGAVQASPVLRAEAVLAVLHGAAARTGTLMVLEDLHWADGDTLAVVDYLADVVCGERVLCLATLRDDGPTPALELLHDLHARRAAEIVRPARLSQRDVADMARTCLHTEQLDGQLVDYLAGAADGLPFLVEELLATLVESDMLVEDGTTWRLRGGPSVQVPESFAATIRYRLAALDDLARRALSAAAMLGRRFPWPLVASIVDVDASGLLAALRSAVVLQLVEPTEDAEWFQFRHALTRDAVMGELLPGERAVLAANAAVAVETAHPDLGGEWCSLAAELWAIAGNAGRAAGLFVDVGRLALSLGALRTAEDALVHSAAVDRDARVAVERDETLLQVLSLAGRTDEAFEVGARLLRRLAGLASRPQQLVEIHVQLARAAVAGNRWDVAGGHLDEARRLLPTVDAGTQARLDALGAHVALGLGLLDDTQALATTAEQAGMAAGLADVACEALEIIGRCARDRALPTAEDAFARAAAVAEHGRLAVWRIRALHELGTIDLFERADPARLAEARDLALTDGLLVTAANLELHISACHSVQLEAEAGLAAAGRCTQLARRCRHQPLVGRAHIFEGLAHAQRGRIDEMEAAVARALEASGDDPQVVSRTWAACRAEAAALDDDRPRLVDCVRRGMRILFDAGQVSSAPYWGLWCLLAAVHEFDDEGAADQPAPHRHRVVRGMVQLTRAVRLGRGGQREAAEAAFARGDAELAYAPWRRHFARRLLCEAAFADGWGQPADWARDGLGFFTERGDSRLAAGCRSMLQAAGELFPGGDEEARLCPTPSEALGSPHGKATSWSSSALVSPTPRSPSNSAYPGGPLSSTCRTCWPRRSQETALALLD